MTGKIKLGALLLLAALAAAVPAGEPAPEPPAGEEAPDRPVRPPEAEEDDPALEEDWLGPDGRAAVDQALDFLAARQGEDGSWRAREQSFPTAITAICGLAFLAGGNLPGRGRHARVVERALEFVRGSVRRNGLIAAAAEERPMYAHGFGLLFLAELYGSLPDPEAETELRRLLEQAVTLVVDSQSPLGGWYYDPFSREDEGSVTITQVQALRSARNAGIYVPRETIDRALDYVRNSLNPDGGLMYQAGRGGESRLPITAAGVMTVFQAGEYNRRETRLMLNYLRARDQLQDWSAADGHFFYCHFYGAQAMYQAGGDYFRRYFPDLRERLLAMQNPDGSWAGDIGGNYSTALAALILQVPARLLPTFRR